MSLLMFAAAPLRSALVLASLGLASFALATGCASSSGDEVPSGDQSSEATSASNDPVLEESDADDVDEISDELDLADDPAEIDDDAQADDLTMLAESKAKTYVNPVAAGCADPGVIRLGTNAAPTFLTACTGTKFPALESSDLVHWSKLAVKDDSGDVRHTLLSKSPSWSDGKWWAPEVHEVGNRFVLYFSANSKTRHRPCIGAATSPSATGPFVDLGRPLLCDAVTGLIDVHEMTDASGDNYLYYKTTTDHQPTIIYGRKLGANGVSFTETGRHALIHDALAWEGDSVEGPWTMQRGKYTYLFYSGATYCNASYAVGVARSESPLKGFKKHGAPILKSSKAWSGPGHNSTVRDGDKLYIVYHAWKGAHTCADSGDRDLLVDRLLWKGGWPFVQGGVPSTSPKPVPTN